MRPAVVVAVSCRARAVAVYGGSSGIEIKLGSRILYAGMGQTLRLKILNGSKINSKTSLASCCHCQEPFQLSTSFYWWRLYEGCVVDDALNNCQLCTSPTHCCVIHSRHTHVTSLQQSCSAKLAIKAHAHRRQEGTWKLGGWEETADKTTQRYCTHRRANCQSVSWLVCAQRVCAVAVVHLPSFAYDCSVATRSLSQQADPSPRLDRLEILFRAARRITGPPLSSRLRAPRVGVSFVEWRRVVATKAHVADASWRSWWRHCSWLLLGGAVWCWPEMKDPADNTGHCAQCL